MKTATDPRHLKRVKLMQDLFSWQFRKGKKSPVSIKKIIDNLPQIDKLISESAPDRPISQINRIDLSILRLAVFELIIIPRLYRERLVSQDACDIISKEAPLKVIIDEAIELGKEYGSDASASFINGALGKLVEVKKVQ